MRHADFDNDLVSDVAISAIGRTVDGNHKAGGVGIARGDGSADGYQPEWYLHQDTPGVSGVPENTDLFGYALAWGDFDADGVDDLVVGVPFEDVNSGGTERVDIGMIHVFPGGDTGFDTSLDYSLNPTQDGWQMNGMNFGAALAAGDFNHDGVDDLAVGAPGTQGSFPVGLSGVVFVFYGGGNTMNWNNGRLYDPELSWHKHTSLVARAAGGALAAGDFDCDGWEELAVGAPQARINGDDGAGGVWIYDENDGNDVDPVQILHQDLGSIPGEAEPDDQFGFALTAGNFRNAVCAGSSGSPSRPMADLVVGIPFENVGSIVDAGYITVIHGGGTLGSHGAVGIHQDTSGVEGKAEEDDRFGFAVLAMRANDDVFGDLIVGIPGENDNRGYIALFKGGSRGIGTAGDALWSQATAGIPGPSLPNDGFGSALGGGDLRHLVVGAPGSSTILSDFTGVAVAIQLGDTSAFSVVTGEMYYQSDFEAPTQDEDPFGIRMTGPRPALVH